MNWQIVTFADLDSTQAYLKTHQKNHAEGHVVVAHTQTCGKGRQNRDWHSSPGGLYFSFLLRPTQVLPYLPQGLLCGLVNTLKSLGLPQLGIKWPNDIYLEERKLSGVLIDSQILNQQPLYYICGVGVNLNQTRFPDALNAISLRQVLHKHFDSHTFLERFLKEFETIYTHILSPHFKSKVIEILTPFKCLDIHKNPIQPEAFFND